MKIQKRESNGVTILDLAGRLTIGEGDIALRSSVREALDSGSTQILLNLKNVTTIDSSGVGELVSCYTQATHRGVKLKLSHLPDKVRDVLHITQLITIFEVFDNEEEATASFA